jgi:hypothetical protein
VTVEDVITSFPHPILPTVQGEPDYKTIHVIRKLLQANARAIATHLGGGTLVHLGLIVSDTSYAMVAPETPAGTTLWVNPTVSGAHHKVWIKEQRRNSAKLDTSARKPSSLFAPSTLCNKL